MPDIPSVGDVLSNTLTRFSNLDGLRTEAIANRLHDLYAHGNWKANAIQRAIAKQQPQSPPKQPS
jgi:hypothetical protein